MSQLVLLHGDHASSQDHWFPYLKEQFEDRGWQVIAPDIPDSHELDLKRWMKYVQGEVTFTPDTVLVGHSSGCPLIMSLLEKSRTPVKKAVLVAGFIEDIGFGVKPILQDTYNWKKIQKNCQEFYFVNSDNDPYHCDDKQGRLMLDSLGGTQVIISGGMHFGTEEYDDVCEEFPLLVKLIED